VWVKLKVLIPDSTIETTDYESLCLLKTKESGRNLAYYKVRI